MWLLARVQGPGVTVFTPKGSQRKNFNDFDEAVGFMLQNGWEPFGADSGNVVLVWFRKRAE
ncbi:MAG: hypothetical protein JXA10_00025 [Anaerolineae bacterium]|nr:hypothetical protein [Anaerolineae bacterium]